MIQLIKYDVVTKLDFKEHNITYRIVFLTNIF